MDRDHVIQAEIAIEKWVDLGTEDFPTSSDLKAQIKSANHARSQLKMTIFDSKIYIFRGKNWFLEFFCFKICLLKTIKIRWDKRQNFRRHKEA